MKKTGGWIAKRYWIQIGRVKWNFACKSGSEKIIKLPHYWEFINTNNHTKVKGKASPYNGDDLYWTKRIGEKYKNSEPQKARLIKKQEGYCKICGLKFQTEDKLEKHHITSLKDGGNNSDKNLMVVHLHCHDIIHGKSEVATS